MSSPAVQRAGGDGSVTRRHTDHERTRRAIRSDRGQCKHCRAGCAESAPADTTPHTETRMKPRTANGIATQLAAAVVGGCAVLLLATPPSRAEVKTVVNHNPGDQATAEFKFKDVPAPAKPRPAAALKFEIVDG